MAGFIIIPDPKACVGWKYDTAIYIWCKQIAGSGAEEPIRDVLGLLHRGEAKGSGQFCTMEPVLFF